VVVAAVSLAGLTGMGLGDASATATGPDVNACDLLTRKGAKRILGKAVRRETSIAGRASSNCSYAVEKDATRVVGLAVGAFASDDEASKAYAKARADARFDGLTVENVRRLGTRAHWLPATNNFQRTVLDEKLVIGELTILEGSRVYTAYVAPPSKAKARAVIKQAIGD